MLLPIGHIVSYKIAGPSEYLAITGLGVSDIKIRKKGWVFGCQSCVTFDVCPFEYSSRVDVVSGDNCALALQTRFFIGADFKQETGLLKYARFFTSTSSIIRELVVGSMMDKAIRMSASRWNIDQNIPGWITHVETTAANEVEAKLASLGLILRHYEVARPYIERVREVREQKETAKAQFEIAQEKASLETEEFKASQALAMGELGREVDIMKALVEKEKLEMQLLEADLELYRKIKQAEADKIMADTLLYVKQKEAEGFQVMGQGLESLMQAAGND